MPRTGCGWQETLAHDQAKLGPLPQLIFSKEHETFASQHGIFKMSHAPAVTPLRALPSRQQPAPTTVGGSQKLLFVVCVARIEESGILASAPHLGPPLPSTGLPLAPCLAVIVLRPCRCRRLSSAGSAYSLQQSEDHIIFFLLPRVRCQVGPPLRSPRMALLAANDTLS